MAHKVYGRFVILGEEMVSSGGKGGVCLSLTILQIVVLLFSPSVGGAVQQQEVELGEVVVTATRMEKPRVEAPASVSVVTKDENQ